MMGCDHSLVSKKAMAATDQGSDVRAERDALARTHPWNSGLGGSIDASKHSHLGTLGFGLREP